MGSEKLRDGLLDLLLKVEEGYDTATKIARSLKLPLTTIISNLKLLEKKGYLTSKKFFNKRVYELSLMGSTATTNFRDPTKVEARKVNKQLYAHKVSWSMKIVKEPVWLRDKLKEGGFISNSHRNWLSLNRKFDNYTIAFHKNRVFVYFTEFSLPGGAPDYFILGNDKMSEIKAFLENEYKGLKLGDLKQHTKFLIHNQHIVDRYGEVALKFQKVRELTGSKLAYHGKNFNVDFSHGPEQEFISSSGAVADALNYAEFVDGFCEAPFQAKDVTDIKSEVVGLQDGIKAILQENKSFKEVLREVTKLQVEQTNNLMAQGRLQAEQTNTMNVFARAMEEHLVLVKELQAVTKALGEGLAEVKKPWIVRVFEGLKKLFHKKPGRVEV